MKTKWCNDADGNVINEAECFARAEMFRVAYRETDPALPPHVRLTSAILASSRPVKSRAALADWAYGRGEYMRVRARSLEKARAAKR